MRILLTACLAAVLCVLSSSTAQAAVTCSFNAGTKTLSVIATANGDTPQIARLAGGDALQVRSGPTTAVACTNGAGSVTTVDTISFIDNTVGGETQLTIDQAGGRFAPGATAEQFGGSEIEMTANMGTGQDFVLVVGGPQADNLRVGRPADDEVKVNFNPTETFVDSDLHITSGGVGFSLLDGHDSINMRGAAGTGDVFSNPGVSVSTGDGDDTVVMGDSQNYIDAGAGNDSVSGGTGSDVLTPGAGDDVFDGGAGQNTVSLYGSTVATRIDLAVTGPQDTGDGTDTFTNVWSIYGGNGDDVLLGDGNENYITGGPGDDRVDGRSGDDYLEGGGGFDTVDYATAPAGVTVKLGFNMISQDTEGSGVEVVGEFEAILGSAFADTLSGDGDGNVLDGGPGSDAIFGLGGPDNVLVRDTEADTADCGSGPDTVVTDLPGVDTLTNCETISAETPPPPGGSAGDGDGGSPGSGAGGAGGPTTGTGEPGATGSTADTIAPKLTGLRFRPVVFRGSKGGRLRLVSTEPATLRIAIERCARKCKRVRSQPATTPGGTASIPVRTRGLRPGRYRAVVVATDIAGNRSAARRARFRIRR